MSRPQQQQQQRMGDLFQQRRRQDMGRSTNSNANLPLEQGVVCSLKESFGFIHSADRPEDIFFHYSEAQQHSDLRIDDEVEYRLGTSGRNAEKLAAFQVRRLEPGTIVWETQDTPGVRVQGLVQRAVRTERGGRNGYGATLDGTIRLRVETDEEESATAAGANGSVVYFSPDDYKPAPRQPGKLARGDLVEFTLVTDRRTKEKYARSITLLLSERERARQEEEKRLLSDASLEHGVVSALKGEYGFLRSNKRREEVYFHYSSFHLEGDDENHSELILEEGQDVQFLVVNEGGTEPGQRRRVSARKVKLQRKGSVKFHDLIASGVTGIVTLCPQPMDSSHALETQGKIKLVAPITTVGDDGQEQVVEEVYLHSRDSPGGTFQFRGGSSVGLWIQAGDKLLFDVAKDIVDGACRAVPTKQLFPRPNPTELQGDEEDDEEGVSRAVRLIELTLAGRAEGFVNALKDNYGFLHYVERPVDVHFKLFQVLPDELQKDLRRHLGIADVDGQGRPLELNVGAEVHFDISVHGTVHSHATRKGKVVQDRENLKAQRILLLPPDTILQSKVLATEVVGVIAKEDAKQPYAGLIDFDNPIISMGDEERHPLVAKLITSYLESDRTEPLVFHDILSLKEDDVVISMLDTLGNGRLAHSYIPVEGECHYPGRLCIQKVNSSEDKQPKGAPGTDDEAGVSDPKPSSEKPKKKKHSKPKDIKSLRYDKSSLVPDMRDLPSPVVGDKVSFDVIQSRRTGQISVVNMKVTERQNQQVATNSAMGVGVVKEVVAARNFGFISLLDENAEQREKIFFDLSQVRSDNGNSKSSPKAKSQRILKGNEVQFDIVIEKSGKKVARNIKLLPKGTIQSKADQNACRGFILLEPTHTKLKNVQLRHTTSSNSHQSERSSRWSSVDDDRNISGTEEPLTVQGCILLLEDPTGMFKDTIPVGKNEAKAAGDNNDKEEQNDIKLCCSHLHYKSGAIAILGAGSSSDDDDATLPKRGDLVSFVKTKSGKTLRDIRLISRAAATRLRGRLEGLVYDPASESKGSAKFIAANAGETTYDIPLSELVGCHASVLKEKESVEGILHEGKIYGVCRTVDLYLESKLGASHKERPKLNLTVKKDRGGTIMAQSMMAKGPDGSNGFAPGWTSRQSKYQGTSVSQGENGCSEVHVDPLTTDEVEKR